MVTEFGMSEKIGPMAVVKREQGAFLPGFGEQTLGGPDVQREIDLEVKRIVEQNYARAKHILVSNRNVLETLANELLECEDMDSTHLQKRLNELNAHWNEGDATPENRTV